MRSYGEDSGVKPCSSRGDIRQATGWEEATTERSFFMACMEAPALEASGSFAIASTIAPTAAGGSVSDLEGKDTI